MPDPLRTLRPDLRISVVHHTPLSSADMFDLLTWRREIMESLLACDIVGFHIPRHAANSVSAARSLFPVTVSVREPVDPALVAEGTARDERGMPTRIRHDGRRILVSADPVGVDAAFIDARACVPETEARAADIRAGLSGAQMILSVSRTDYTKGGVEQLESFGLAPEACEELRGRVRLLHVSVEAARGMAACERVQADIEAAAVLTNPW